MTRQEIADQFNDAMRNLRHVYFTFEGSDRDRKELAEGIMKMERLMDPIWERLKQHP